MSRDYTLESRLVKGVLVNLSKYLSFDIPNADHAHAWFDAYELLGVLARQVDALKKGLADIEHSTDEQTQKPRKRCSGCRKTRVEGPRAPDGHSVVSKWATYPVPTVLEVDDDLRRLITRVDALEKDVDELGAITRNQTMVIEGLTVALLTKG